jgi:ubiquinone/menaquinone biosynthesis C-methylase UbiE
MMMSRYSYHDLLMTIGISSAHPGGMILTQSVIEQVAREVELPAHSRVLEVGCGTGETARFLAERFGWKVTAIDREPRMLQTALHHCPDALKQHIHFQQAQTEQLPFADGTFDLLLAESVTLFTDVVVSLKEYARVLKRNGILLSLEMMQKERLAPEEVEEFQQFYGLNRLYTDQEWKTELSRQGFRETRILRQGRMCDLPPNTEHEQLMSRVLTPDFPLELLDVMNHHAALTARYQHKLGYTYLVAMKKGSAEQTD